MTAPDRQAASHPPDPCLRLIAALGFGAWFWIVYAGCDRLAEGFTHRFSLHAPWDDRLPFVPELGLAYLLINPLLLLPVFALRETAALLALCGTLAAEVAAAGVVFLVFPVEPPATPPAHGSLWLGLADAANGTFNCFPSLHVALAVSVGLVLGAQLRLVGRLALWGVVFLVAVSTVLTRQHFLADVPAGALLAGLAVRFLFPALRRRFAAVLARTACRRTPPCPAGPPGCGSCSSGRRPGT